MTVVLLIFVGTDIHFSKRASSKIHKLICNGSIKLLSYFFYSMNIWFCQTMNYMKICAQLMCWNIYYVFYIIWEYSHIHYHHWIFIFWVAFLQWHSFCTGITVCCKFFKCPGNSMTIYHDHCEHSNLHNIHVV